MKQFGCSGQPSFCIRSEFRSTAFILHSSIVHQFINQTSRAHRTTRVVGMPPVLQSAHLYTASWRDSCIARSTNFLLCGISARYQKGHAVQTAGGCRWLPWTGSEAIREAKMRPLRGQNHAHNKDEDTKPSREAVRIHCDQRNSFWKEQSTLKHSVIEQMGWLRWCSLVSETSEKTTAEWSQAFHRYHCEERGWSMCHSHCGSLSIQWGYPSFALNEPPTEKVHHNTDRTGFSYVAAIWSFHLFCLFGKLDQLAVHCRVGQKKRVTASNTFSMQKSSHLGLQNKDRISWTFLWGFLCMFLACEA